MSTVSASVDTVDIVPLVAENIRARRRELNLTQTQLAERMGIRQPNIAALESGRSGMGLETLARIAAALELEPADLLSRPRAPRKKSR